MTVKYIASNYGSIGTLDAAILSSDTEFDVTGSSLNLANLTAGQAYLLCLGDPAGTREFIRATVFSADHFAGVTRGFESSKNGGIARGWPSGTPVTMIISAGYLDNLIQPPDLDNYAKFTDIVSQPEAEAGTSTDGWLWSALRVRQAMVAYVTGGFSINFGSTKGHIKFPSYFGGYIFQYAIGAEDSSGQPSQTITFDISFPTAVKCAGVCTQISTTSGESDAFYQSMPPSNTDIVVNRQLAGGADDRPTKPIVWAVGS